MDRTLQIFLIVCLVLFLALIIRFLGRKQLNLKYSLTWLLAGAVMLVAAIFPKLVTWVGRLVGIATPVNTIFLFGDMFMILILMTLTLIVSHLNRRVFRLTQAVALLERRLRALEPPAGEEPPDSGGGEEAAAEAPAENGARSEGHEQNPEYSVSKQR